MAAAKSDTLAKNAAKATGKKKLEKKLVKSQQDEDRSAVSEKDGAVAASQAQEAPQADATSIVTAQGAQSTGSGVVSGSGASREAGAGLAGAADADGFSLSDLGWLGLGLLGVGGVAAAASGGGGGSSSSAATTSATTPPATTEPATTTISGSVVAGPVVSGNGLTVTAMKADGSVLGTAKVNGDGSYSISYKEQYKGNILLKVTNADTGVDYMNEATRAGKDLDSDLYGVVQLAVPGGYYYAEITPVTGLALKVLGLSGDNLSSIDAASITSVNTGILKLFNLSQEAGKSLFTLAAQPLVDASGAVSTGGVTPYGALLAAISGMESLGGLTSDKALATIADGLQMQGGVLSWRTDSAGENAQVELSAGVSRAIQAGALTVSDALVLKDALLGGNSSGVFVYSDAADLRAGQTANVYFKLSGASTDFTASDVSVSGGVLSGFALDTSDSTSQTYKAVFTPSVTNALAAVVSVGPGAFTVGGVPNVKGATKLSGDTETPTWSSVTLLANGQQAAPSAPLKEGDVITVKVHYEEIVNVNGLPQYAIGEPKYAIKIGSATVYADYASGSGTKDLTFNYVIKQGDNDSVGVGVDPSMLLNGGIVSDVAGNVISQAPPTTGMASSIKVDAVAPDAPTVALATDSGSNTTDHVTNVSTLAATGVEVGATVQYSATGTDGWSTAQPAAAEGLNTVYVRQLDEVGHASGSQSFVFTLDTHGPVVSSVALVGAGTAGAFKEGDTIQIQVAFDDVVTVAGTPTIDLNIASSGGNQLAHYLSGSGSNTLIFEYTIPATGSGGTSIVDSNGISIDANSLQLNGASIVDVAGNAADLSHAAIVDNSAFAVDTSPLLVNTASITSATGAVGGVLNAGDVVNVALALNKVATVTGTPTIDLDIGGTMVSASYVSGSGSDTLIFSYTIQPGQNDGNGIAIAAIQPAGGTIVDLVGHALSSAASVSDNPAYLVDTAGPEIVSVAISGADGAVSSILNANDVVHITVDTNEVVYVDGTPQLNLNIGGSQVAASYVSGSGSQHLMFDYVIQAGQNAPSGITIDAGSLNLNGGSLVDTVGNAINQAVPGAAANSAYYAVDTTALTVISMSVYGTESNGNPKSGTLAAGDKVMVRVDLSEPFVVTTNQSTATLSLDFGNGEVRDAVFDSSNSVPYTNYLQYSYIVQNGDSALAGVGVISNLNFAPSDDAGNNLVGGTPPTTSSVVVDASAPTVVNAAVLDGRTDFDVRSDIVLDMGTDVNANIMGMIRVVNDGGTGFGGESIINSYSFSAISPYVTIAGSKVTINLPSDLDLANNYHIEIDAGVFTSTTNGLGNAAFGTPVGGQYALNFSTVTPGYSAAGDINVAQQAYKMAADGTLVASNKWISIETLGSDTALKSLDAATGDYAFVLKNQATNIDSGTGSWLNPPEVAVDSTHVSLKNFTTGSDILYFDNQSGQPVASFDQIMTVKPGVTPLGYNLASGSNGEGGPAELEFNSTPAWTNALLAASGTVIVG